MTAIQENKGRTDPDQSTGRQLPFTEYLHIIESYGISWGKEKVARDTWQNFFDANGYTLDNVTCSLNQVGDKFRVAIEGPAEYDYRYMLHTGGTTKSEDTRAAGAFGEGAKLAAFVLLRDLGASEVAYESGETKITFFFDSVKQNEYPHPIRGLFVRVEKVPHRPGSRFQVEMQDMQLATAFLGAKDLFYHKDNSDFKNPTVNNEVGGFTIHVGRGGNIYEAGQRRNLHHYDGSLIWGNVNDATIWTWEKTFALDRDRGDISSYDVENKAIAKIVGKMPVEGIGPVITGNPDLWHKSEILGLGTGILRALCDRYATQKGKPLSFPQEYIADDNITPKSIKDLLVEQGGYVICDSRLAKVGMVRAFDKFRELQRHYKIEPNENEKKRLEILRRAVEGVTGSPLDEQLWMFSEKDEATVVSGQSHGDFLWISQEKLRESFPNALATILKIKQVSMEKVVIALTEKNAQTDQFTKEWQTSEAPSALS